MRRRQCFPPAGLGERAYAWLERIENGVLVHHLIAVKHRQKVPKMPLGYPHETPGFEAGQSPEEVMEYFDFMTRTIYCKDQAEVFKAIEAAAKAQEEIEKLERDGKLEGGGAYIASA